VPPSPLSLRAALRSTGGRVVRRLGLLPGGDPDGLGEDRRLGDLAPAQRVVVFFPEPLRNAYQLEQWLGPLTALDARHGVLVITQDSRTTARLRERTTLPVLCVGRASTLDGLVDRGRLALALYVSHHPRNFQLLRYPQLAHVYLGHGDSDKGVSASNQLKAYDQSFVAGQAAIDRVAGELMWFGDDRLVPVGRPQLAATDRRVAATGRPTVLYAPTWEGGQPSVAYSSVVTHAEALVRSLTAAGVRVVYRPHPRTGANRRDVAAADAALRRVFDEPAVRATGSTVDGGRPLADAFADADLLITDVSSVAVEWLPTGRPLVVTLPAEPGAVVGSSPLLDVVPRLGAEQAGRAADLVTRCLEQDREAQARADLVRYYLGEADAGLALARFLDACDELLSARDAARGAVARSAR
jgi:CDP-glycerol:poly(glycerophosphate) glycerophosphotransferase